MRNINPDNSKIGNLVPNEQWKVEDAIGMIEIYLPGYNVLHDCCTIFYIMKILSIPTHPEI